MDCPLPECIYEHDDERERRERISPNRASTLIFIMILGPEKKRTKYSKIGRPKLNKNVNGGCPECGKIPQSDEFAPYCSIDCSDKGYWQLFKNPPRRKKRGTLKDNNTKNCVACNAALPPLKDREKGLRYYCSKECRNRCYAIPSEDEPFGLPYYMHELPSNSPARQRGSGLSTMRGFPSCGRKSNEAFWAAITFSVK